MTYQKVGSWSKEMRLSIHSIKCWIHTSSSCPRYKERFALHCSGTIRGDKNGKYGRNHELTGY